jgi:hypothetical protein
LIAMRFIVSLFERRSVLNVMLECAKVIELGTLNPDIHLLVKKS